MCEFSKGPTCDQPSGNSPHTIMYKNHKTAHIDSTYQCLLVGRCWQDTCAAA